MESKGTRESVRKTRSRKRKSETDEENRETEDQNTAPGSPRNEPRPLVRSYSSPDILLSDILQTHRHENLPSDPNGTDRGGRPKRRDLSRRDEAGLFLIPDIPSSVGRGRPKNAVKAVKYEYQRSVAPPRNESGEFIHIIPFDFDNEENIEYDSDPELLDTEIFDEHCSLGQNFPETHDCTEWADVSENLGQLNLSQVADQDETTEPNLAGEICEPTLTTSEKKIGTVDNNKLTRNRPIQMQTTDLNCTIWDDSVLQDALEKYECECDNPKISIGPLQGAKGSGSFNGPCMIQCKGCDGPPMVIESPGGTTLKNRLDLASIMNGMDYKELNAFLLTLGLGHIPRTTFFEMRAQMMQPVVEAGRQVTAENQNEAKAEYIAKGYELDDDGCVHMAASLDGTWQIKGFTSPTGAVAAIDVITGKPLDFHVLSKVCPIQGCKPDEQQEEIAHECLRNYSGPSGGMEVAGVKEIFSRTMDYGVKIKYMIADGDTKSYREAKASYNDHPVVDKGECMNHHCKRIPVAVDKMVDHYLNTCRSTAGTPKITQKTPPVEGGPRPWGLKKKLDKSSSDIKHLKVCEERHGGVHDISVSRQQP